MKVAIVSEGNTRDSKVAKVFARCNCFAIYNMKSSELEYVDNPYIQIKDHAGEEVARFLANKGVKRIIGYEFGSKARKTTDQYLIQLVLLGRDHMKVDEVLKMLESTNINNKI